LACQFTLVTLLGILQ